VRRLALTLPGGTVGDVTGQDKEATMTAPLQVIAVSFSRGAGTEDRILAEVDRLRGRGVLRLLDMLFVAKSQDGTIERLTVGDDEDFGSLLAAVVPVAKLLKTFDWFVKEVLRCSSPKILFEFVIATSMRAALDL